MYLLFVFRGNDNVLIILDGSTECKFNMNYTISTAVLKVNNFTITLRWPLNC